MSASIAAAQDSSECTGAATPALRRAVHSGASDGQTAESGGCRRTAGRAGICARLPVTWAGSCVRRPACHAGRVDGGRRDGAPVGRRVVLGMLGLGAAGVVGGGWLSRVAAGVAGAASRHDPTGLSALLPSAGWRFYTVTDGFPARSAQSYRLRVTGHVGHELSLSLDDLQVLPRVKLTRDFQCVTGWRVDGVHWEGVRLRDVLDSASVTSPAAGVRFVSFDGVYTESLTLEQSRREDVLVVDTMDGAPVSRAHGGPVRLLVAPMYGYKSCKWLGEIQVTEQVVPGYWEGFGYDQDAWVGRSNGRSDAPT